VPTSPLDIGVMTDAAQATADPARSDALPVVLDEAYAATVDPERYESLLDAWESYLQRMNESTNAVEDPAAAYAAHFSHRHPAALPADKIPSGRTLLRAGNSGAR